MPVHQAYPIANMKAGEVTARRPWLLARDAFELLENCHLKDGVLEKKKGYAPIGQNVADDQVHQMQATDSEAGTTAAHTGTVMGLLNQDLDGSVTLLVASTTRANRYSPATDPPTMVDLTRNRIDFDFTGQDFVPAVDDVITNGGDGVDLVTNGGFATDTDWTKGTGWTIAGGKLVGTATTDNASPTVPILTVGKWYKITFTISVQTGGTVAIDCGSGTAGTARSTAATFTEYLQCTGSTDLLINGGTAWTGTIDDVIVEEIAVGTIEKIFVRGTGTLGTNAEGGILFKNDGSRSGDFTAGDTLRELTGGALVGTLGNAVAADSDRLFTGTDLDFFRGADWNNILYFCNGDVSDGIWQFDGTHYWERWIDLDVEGGPDNDVTGAKHIFIYKGRIVILNTTERGSTYRQRARWSETNLPGTWKDSKYVDAPTDHTIRAAAFIDRDLVVWFDRSTWKLVYTADPTLPFEWERIDDERGLIAPYSLVARGIEQWGLGRSRVLHTDGRFVKTADFQKPNFIKEQIAPGKEAYSFGLYFDDLQQYMITYVANNDLGAPDIVGEPPTADATNDGKPQHLLVYSLNEKNFATYAYNVHCLGQTYATRDVRLDDIEGLLDDLDYSFDTAEPAGSRQLLIFGDRAGKVFEFNVGDDHDGSAFSFQAKTGRWNPYLAENKQVHCQKLMLLVERHESATLDIDHFINTDNVALQTWSNLAFTGTDLDKETVWLTITVNATGNWHRFRFYNSAANNRPRIHAIVPFFRPAGALEY